MRQAKNQMSWPSDVCRASMMNGSTDSITASISRVPTGRSAVTTPFSRWRCTVMRRMEKAECLAVMQNFNSNLEEPLSAQTVDLKVESAYSGEYYGASNRHINALMYAWCEITDSRRNTFWFQKHAKKREDRERSHYMEWERDLYLYVNKRAEEGYLVTTTAQIMEDLGIARSSLYGLLKITNNVFWSATKGRNARVTLYTRKTLFQHALNCVRKFNVKKTEYKLYIETLLPEANRAITDAITAVLESFQENDENTRYKAVSEINTS